MNNVHRSFYIFLKPKIIYLLIELSILLFILVSTQKQCAINYFIIVYFMKKYHFPWISVPKVFNINLIIFLQTPYLATGSNLSWVELVMVKLVAS